MVQRIVDEQKRILEEKDRILEEKDRMLQSYETEMAALKALYHEIGRAHV